jgi:S-adenosylmethionine:tRNA-ribosyltransferase-isomerase (queuine synthetase)
MNTAPTTIQFNLPDHLACPKPIELRNLPRDGVRLLVTTGPGDVDHTTFSKIDTHLEKGDVLVVNTSAYWWSTHRLRAPQHFGYPCQKIEKV